MVLTSPSQSQRSRIIVIAVVAAIIAVTLIGVLLSFDSIGATVQAARQSRPELRRGPLRPLRPAYPRRRDGARPAVRHRAAAVQPLLSRRHPQLLPERVHVRRLALRRLLSRAGLRHRHDGIPLCLCPGALAARPISRSSRRFSARSAKSFIIDTDHWRHFWLMLGVMWGMFAAAQRWKADRRSSAQAATRVS